MRWFEVLEKVDWEDSSLELPAAKSQELSLGTGLGESSGLGTELDIGLGESPGLGTDLGSGLVYQHWSTQHLAQHLA